MNSMIALLGFILLLIVIGWFGGAYLIISYLQPKEFSILIAVLYFISYPFGVASLLCTLFDFSH